MALSRPANYHPGMSEPPTLADLLRKELETVRQQRIALDAGESAAMGPVQGVENLPLAVQRKRLDEIIRKLEAKLRKAEGRNA